MRTVILLVILVAASATETAALLKQLKPARQSPFADYFFGLLELKQNDKVAEIAQVVKGVLDKLIAAQGAEDAEHSKVILAELILSKQQTLKTGLRNLKIP